MALKKEEIIIIEPKEMFVGKERCTVTPLEFGEYESEECAKVKRGGKTVTGRIWRKNQVSVPSFSPYIDSSAEPEGGSDLLWLPARKEKILGDAIFFSKQA